ncbi:MAG TPA: zinc ribbon domain-containing protein [Candidatus Limnocylindria bacterium]
MIRRDAAIGLTRKKRLQVVELGRRFARGRQRYLRNYWHPQHLDAILSDQRRLVEQRRRLGWLVRDLSVHQNKVCLETTIGILRASWQSAIRRAVIEIFRDATLNSDEKQDSLRVLRTPSLLQSCVLGQTDPRWDPSQGRLWRRLRRIVLRSRGRMPRISNRLWFDLDCNLYRVFDRPDDRHFRGAWLAVTGLVPRERINIPLAGSGLDEFTSRTGLPASRPTIRVVVKDRVTFFVLGHRRRGARDGDIAAGIDKGFTTLVTLATTAGTDAAYGVGAGALIGKIADRAVAASKARRRVAAHERSLRNSERDKAKRMRRANLGARRAKRRFDRDRAQLRQHVDSALNELFREQASVARLYCEDLTFRTSPLSRELNRKLSRWLKGYLHQRLTYKAELNGVGLTVVNAAYTSQSCPRCWFTSSTNRHGERFQCAQCGNAGSADAIAATNVLRRGSDSAITRDTPHGDVKRILDARWRSARNGRAWGSNDAGPAVDAPGGFAGRQSREQPGAHASGLVGPHGGALLAAFGRPRRNRGARISRLG